PLSPYYPHPRLSVILTFLYLGCAGPLHSFPTRRSSDLSLLSIQRRWMRSFSLMRTSTTPATCRGSWHMALTVRSMGHPRLSTLQDRKSTRLNSSHQIISYAVFCLKKKKDTCLHTTTHS